MAIYCSVSSRDDDIQKSNHKPFKTKKKMAKINSSSLGSFNGKVGNVVAYTVHGKNIVRIYTDQVSNPRTVKQQLIRARFTELVKLGSDMLSAVRIGYAYRAKQRKNTPLNNFMTGNWEAVSASSPDDVTVNYSELTLAVGPLTGVAFGSADWGADEHLCISAPFNGNSGMPGADDADEVYIFAYVPELGQGLMSAASFRTAGSVTLEVPAGWNGMTAHLWGFAVGCGDTTGGLVSDSSYIGHGEIQ